MGMDSIGFDEDNLQSFNRYAYANNNPYLFSDPDGNLPLLIPIIWAVGAAWTAYDTYTTYQNEGAMAAGGTLVFDAAVTAVAGAAGKGLLKGAKLAKEGLGSLGKKLSSKNSDNATDFFEGTKYTDKVKAQMQQGDFHSFPESVEGFQDAGKVSDLIGGDGVVRQKLEIPGGYKGREGSFEFIKEPNGDINHRLFKANKEQ
jgi:hypothetical protein